MINHHNGSTETGGFFMLAFDFGPPWPKMFAGVFQLRLEDGFLDISVNSLGQLIVEISKTEKSSETLLVQVASCPLHAPMKIPVVLLVTWDLARETKIYINKVLVGSTNVNDSVPPRFVVPPATQQTNVQTYDFSEENKKATIKRSGKFAGHQPKPNRQLADADYLFDELQSNSDQLLDLLDLMKSGKHNHVSGLSSKLRLLIADNTGMPLLQTCAGIVNAPLIVYTLPDPGRPLLFTPSMLFKFDTSAVPTDLHGNPIDIDVWLELMANYENERPYTHREMILAVGNSIGSHVDRNVHPVVTTFQAGISKLNDSENAGDLLVNYFMHVSEIVSSLCRGILILRPPKT
jgi:hypothetical protein